MQTDANMYKHAQNTTPPSALTLCRDRRGPQVQHHRTVALQLEGHHPIARSRRSTVRAAVRPAGIPEAAVIPAEDPTGLAIDWEDMGRPSTSCKENDLDDAHRGNIRGSNLHHIRFAGKCLHRIGATTHRVVPQDGMIPA